MLSSILVLTIAGIAWLVFTFTGKQRFGYSYIQTPAASAIFFLSVTALLALMFPREALSLYSHPTPLAGICLLLVFSVVNPALYAFARARGKGTPIRDLELLAIDNRFLISKSADVLFQQTAFGIFITLLANAGFSFVALALIFAVLFIAGHVGMFLRVSPRWASYFLFSSLVFSIPLVWQLLYVPAGIYFALCVHMLWYTVGGAAFALIQKERPR